jgi:hypothetical protein
MNVHQNWFALQDSTGIFAFLIQLDFSYHDSSWLLGSIKPASH